MSEVKKEMPLLGADNNALVAILGVNLIIASLFGFFRVLYYLEGFTLTSFDAEVAVHFKLFSPSEAFLNRPWTLFVYAWSHDGFWFLLGNMIWLSLFGYILQKHQANKHLFPIYLYSSLVGGIFFCAIGSTQTLMGANISVLSFAMACILWAPKHLLMPELPTGVPVWLLVCLYLVLQIAKSYTYDMASLIALFMGGSTGLVYILLLKRGIDLGNWMHQLLSWTNKILAPK